MDGQTDNGNTLCLRSFDMGRIKNGKNWGKGKMENIVGKGQNVGYRVNSLPHDNISEVWKT